MAFLRLLCSFRQKRHADIPLHRVAKMAVSGSGRGLYCVMGKAQTTFRCLYCGTEYKVVRVTESDGPHDEKAFCRHCLRRLPHSEGDFTLKYILIARPNERTDE